MRILKVLTALLLVVMLSSAGVVKKKDTAVYLYGVSSSFSDTVVYFTEIQQLDIELAKGGVLPEMHNYSSQLENYIGVMKDKPHQTAATFYSTKKNSLEKERTKLYNRYKKKMRHSVVFLSSEDFTYQAVISDENQD